LVIIYIVITRGSLYLFISAYESCCVPVLEKHPEEWAPGFSHATIRAEREQFGAGGGETVWWRNILSIG
jgi:hypothetical protein